METEVRRKEIVQKSKRFSKVVQRGGFLCVEGEGEVFVEGEFV